MTTIFTNSPDVDKQTLANYQKGWKARLEQKYREPSLSAVLFAKGSVDPVFSDGMTRKGGKLTRIGGGYKINWGVITTVPEKTEFVGPWDSSEGSVAPVSDRAEVDLRIVRTRIDRNEIDDDVNSGKAALEEMYAVHVPNAMIDHFNKIHGAVWSAPTGPGDYKTPYGVKYYIVRNATESTANTPTGDLPSGFTTCAGLTHAKWKNYVFHYTNMTREDMVAKIHRAIMTMRCTPQVDIPMDQQPNVPPRYIAFCNLNVWLALGNIAITQNANQPRDPYNLVVSGSSVSIAGIKFIYDDTLDSETGNPIFLLDLDTWEVPVLKGRNGAWWYRLSMQMNNVKQPLVATQYIHSMYSLCCYDRQRNAIIYQK